MLLFLPPSPLPQRAGKMREWWSDDTVRWNRKGVTYINFQVSPFFVERGGTGKCLVREALHHNSSPFSIPQAAPVSRSSPFNPTSERCLEGGRRRVRLIRVNSCWGDCSCRRGGINMGRFWNTARQAKSGSRWPALRRPFSRRRGGQSQKREIPREAGTVPLFGG